MDYSTLEGTELSGVFADFARALARYRVGYGGDPDLNDTEDLTLLLPLLEEVIIERLEAELADLLRERAGRLSNG